MRRLLTGFIVLAALIGAAGWFLSAPQSADAALYAGLEGDPAAGERIFHAAGCASCHAAPDAEGEARLVLAGGARFESDFGTFVAPNISPDPDEGIGGWSLEAFATALTKGVAPDGRHYYPAFPYTAYAKMAPQDVADLKAYMDRLPPSDAGSAPHEVGFPFTLTRGIGLWKRAFLDERWVVTDAPGAELERGRYLVEALGHCAECHTPRNFAGALDIGRWMTGAPNPSGRGRIPAITPDELGWDASEIAWYLESGFTPDYDSAGGSMAKVVTGLSKLPDEDRAAIAAYLLALPRDG
ncbi:c-type cytochrome [Rhodosalinus sp. K401]|uniref:c-type cytochrome n=1 Tax=Rhodosalinus sp. K401 TaxID=3239195 RepID=UPI0035269F98